MGVNFIILFYVVIGGGGLAGDNYILLFWIGLNRGNVSENDMGNSLAVDTWTDGTPLVNQFSFFRD